MEGERERIMRERRRPRDTDWQKWIIRTESFSAVSDTEQRNKDIKFHCKVFFL